MNPTSFNDMAPIDTKAADHVHTSLSQPREIRVAIIEPAMDSNAPLKLSFHHDTLEELEGRYEAVSYV